MKLTRVAAILALAVGTSVSAQTYVEVDYTQIKIKSSYPSIGNLETNPDLIGVLAGAELTQNLAVEGLLATGLSSSDTTKNGATQVTPVNTKINNYYGVFAKPKIKVAEGVELFARLGYVHGSSTGSAAGNSIDTSSGNWAYGVGITYSLTPKLYLTGSLQQTATKNNVDSTSTTVGLGYRF